MIREVQVGQPGGEWRGEKQSVEKVLESFETVFISELVRGLREALAKELGEGGGPGKDIYAAWFDQALSEALVRGGGMGLKEVLNRWISSANLSPEKDTEPSSGIQDSGPACKVFPGRADK